MTFPLPLKSGTVVGGHYIIDGLINRGGFGSVYRGIDTSEGDRPCAIKETYDVTPAARRQALMEAGILFTIKSKHLPQVYDAFEEGGRFYLVMQLIEGQNLLQLMQARGSPCREQEVLVWFLPIMQVLQELHSRTPAVVHRDIKPANIILTVEGYAVLVDFGVTKLYDPASASQTMIKAVTEGFSPLEQYTGTTTPQSDIYALAATMYYLLTATRPPSAISRSLRETLQPPSLLNPQISPRVEQALLKGLALNPEGRFRSMREFAEALQGRGVFMGHAEPTVRVIGGPLAGPGPGVRPGAGAAPAMVVKGPSGPRPLSYPVSPASPAGPGRPSAGQRAQVIMVPPQSLRPLPSPFGQGCLWGLLQGVGSALLVLLLRTQEALLLSLVVGWLCYLLAGFMSTRRGGSSLRGARAGFWAGICSTVMFWLVFGCGLLIIVVQRLQSELQRANQPGLPLQIGRELTRIVHQVAPWLFSLPAAGNGSNVPGPLLYLGGGLLLAMVLGWVGGLLGRRVFLSSRWAGGGA
ncbi:serine/threonine protein kinase [Thermogemmatispora carboxidivorans]|uniref:serine/threonine protein kinase n=1 Tax=Thermogemmatispora carboxidivorans TaxID=1382306 RepID=UPI000699F688|nr:serine/threonine-protein kinase [Thermogemmatispora carboxidivorans]